MDAVLALERARSHKLAPAETQAGLEGTMLLLLASVPQPTRGWLFWPTGHPDPRRLDLCCHDGDRQHWDERGI